MAGVNVYEMVTERIIEQLENGTIPWKKPWTGTRSGAYNRVSMKPYSLLNQMLLLNSGEYATFKQWTEVGGHVKKGAKAEIVKFWKIQLVEEEQEDGTKIKKQIPLLRYYNVFHIFLFPILLLLFQSIQNQLYIANNFVGISLFFVYKVLKLLVVFFVCFHQ
mgnify:CR=1 FL=1